MNTQSSTIESPLIAYRFACDYANEGEKVIAIARIMRGRVEDVIHPGDFSLMPMSDEDILESLTQGRPDPVFENGVQRVIYAIHDSETLRQILGVEDLYYSDPESDTWCEYEPLGYALSNGIQSEADLFAQYGIELRIDEEETLLVLLSQK